MGRRASERLPGLDGSAASSAGQTDCPSASIHRLLPGRGLLPARAAGGRDPPPPVYVIVPSPPSLVYVPTPRVDPAPEVTLPTGRWARHGNGVDYPYVWVWEGPARAR